ncbi:helix-turn-helix domain-containing protein [Maribellus comscasis]|uniref:Helix-turn-helix domain-containing protein n=1 Tax=Maribellus comscasis TaxID=2681766 RepID=A0A6I6K6P3_9BACT|nr:helix-turn-helix domain-containing protein [Maribellus comscasis]
MFVNAIFLGSELLPFEVVDYFKPGIFPFLFLLGPLLYFYVSSLAIHNFQLKKQHLIHILPLLLVGIHRSVTHPISFSNPYGFEEYSLSGNNKIYYLLLLLSLFLYWFFAIRIILSHRKKIPYYFSNYTPKNTFSWLIFVVIIFVLLFLADFILSLVFKIFSIRFVSIFPLTTNLTIFTFLMVYFGNNQSAIYKLKKNSEKSAENDQSEKYKRSALSDYKVEHINQKVTDYLKTKKPYLDPDFNLQMMVDDLNISRQNLSQVINLGQKKNFYKLINEYRIEEVKKMIVNAKYSHYSILGIAFECGFNSKTSFHRIFKEETSQTPTEYKKSLN